MKTDTFLKSNARQDRRGFTLMELLTVITIISILASVAAPALISAIRAARMSASLQHASGIVKALQGYAADYDGLFPGEVDLVTEEEYGSSNDIFAALIPDYLDSERPFAVSTSSWGSRADGRIDDEEDRLRPGENHWAYIAGLTNSSRSEWPLVVDGTNGSGQYTREPGEKGGCWEGRKGIVIKVGGSAEIVPLRGDDDARYIPRYGYPEENALDVSAYMGDNAVLMDPAGGSGES